MCGSRSGIIFFYCFFSLFLLCLAPDALAAVTASQNTINMSLNDLGQWELSDLPATTGPSTISDGPAFYYFTNPNNTPVVDSSGDVTANLPAPVLPVPQDSAGITGISAADEVTASDIAAALAPVLTTLAGLTPEGRAAIVGGTTLWSMYENYYNSVNPSSSSSSPTNTYYCGSTAETSTQAIVPDGTPSCGSYAACGLSQGCFVTGTCSTAGEYFMYGGPYCSSGVTPTPAPSGSSSTSAIPAPTLAQVANMLAQNATNSLTALQNLPASTVQALPMTTTLSGPSTATGPSTTSTSTDSSGNTTTTTTTPTYNMTYSGSNASVTTNDNIKTTTCTAAGSCTTTNTTTQPVNQSPFVPPSSNYPKVSTVVPTNSVPFTAFSFGAPWLPKTCPSAPTFQVCAIGGVDCQTEKLPTYVICQLASGIEPVVTSGGALLGILILAW